MEDYTIFADKDEIDYKIIKTIKCVKLILHTGHAKKRGSDPERYFTENSVVDSTTLTGRYSYYVI